MLDGRRKQKMKRNEKSFEEGGVEAGRGMEITTRRSLS